MLTTRTLPADEWHKLRDTYAAPVVDLLRENARVVVVEKDGQIVGCHLLQPVLHAECLWIHPEHRKRAAVGGRLWRAVQRVVREEFGVSHFCTAAADADVEALLAKVGATPIDARVFVVPVREG